MENSTVVHSRNKFIILFFIVNVIVHFIFIAHLRNTYEIGIAFWGLLSVITLIVLHYRGMNPRALRLFIITSFNAYIFLINLFVPDLSNLLYLLFPIILATFYHVTRLTIWMTLITATELLVLFYLYFPNYISVDKTVGFTHIVSIFLMTAILFLLYACKISPQWNLIYGENKRMDAILTSKEGYLDLFFKHADDAIAVFGLDLKIITVNPAFEKLYGWQKKDCIGKSPRLFPLSEDIASKLRIENVLKGTSYHQLRTKESRKDGTEFDAELTITPIFDEEKKIIAMSFIARDISLRLQAERLKIDTEKVKAIGEVSASVAHEIRNPLTSISGFIQMMNNDSANPYRTYTEIMHNEINRIDLIVGEFLVLSKPNSKKSSTFFIEQMLREAVAMFELEFSNRSIFCDVQIPKNTALINGYGDSMKQVFINLLKNACEALVNNGIVTVTVTHQEKTVSVFIRDNGPGMDQHTLDNLYEPFFTTKQDGTGLGMMITKKIIVDHGGTLIVTSKENEGTETVITLPLT